MSNNIQGIDILSQKDFAVTQAKFDALKNLYGEVAEGLGASLFEYPDYYNNLFTPDGDLLRVNTLYWNDDGSGSTFDTFCEILADFQGEAELALHWEDGVVRGLRLKDGKVTHHPIIMTLGPEEADDDPEA